MLSKIIDFITEVIVTFIRGLDFIIDSNWLNLYVPHDTFVGVRFVVSIVVYSLIAIIVAYFVEKGINNLKGKYACKKIESN